MAAGVHDAHFLTQVGRPYGRPEWQFRFLRHGQRVHVGPYGHHRTRSAAFEHAHHAGMGYAGLDLDSERGEMIRHQRRRLELPIAQFRVPVDVLPHADGFPSVLCHQRGHDILLGNRDPGRVRD